MNGDGFLQFFDESVDLVRGDVGHDDNVRNVIVARQLPALDHLIVEGSFQHDCGRQVVEAARHSNRLEFVLQVPGRIHAMDDVALDPSNALFAEAVPQIEGRLTVATAHDGRIDGIEVIDPLFKALDVFLATQSDAARHGCAQEFVSTDGNAVNGFPEGNFRRKFDKRHHECKESAVAMDVELFPGDGKLFEHAKDPIEVVDSAFDGRPNVDIEDDRSIAIVLDGLCQNVVIDFSHGQCWDRLTFHAVIARRLEDRIMRFLRRVEDAVGEAFAGHEDAVQIAFGARRGH